MHATRHALVALVAPAAVSDGRVRIPTQYPSKLRFLDYAARYKVAKGGRGGAKSWNFARKLIERAYGGTVRILCAREYQNSIQDSVHKLLCDQIDKMGLSQWFDTTKNSIKCKIAGPDGAFSEFIFVGIKTNVTKVKSMEGIDICWVEEAEKVSADSWEVLIPTIRKPGSEIWISFNPNLETDPTYKRFVTNTPDDAVVVDINWRDNPWFPETLRKEMEYLRRVDIDAYMHVWEGKTRNNSDAQIFKNKVHIESFEPHAEGTGEWHGPYFGADWGFAQDPTTMVKCWINRGRLLIEYEAYGVGVDIDHTAAMFDKIPGAREHICLADSARPETISYMQRHGYGSMRGVVKWAGSVEDGIAHLRGYERIVFHPRCDHGIMEARLYSYKVDKLTSMVLPVVLDSHNHIWDAIRYAIQPLIKARSNQGLMEFMRAEVTKIKDKAPEQEPTVGGAITTVGVEQTNATKPSLPWTRAALDSLNRRQGAH